jgi:hypothetical protein
MTNGNPGPDIRILLSVLWVALLLSYTIGQNV